MPFLPIHRNQDIIETLLWEANITESDPAVEDLVSARTRRLKTSGIYLKKKHLRNSTNVLIKMKP